MAVRQGRPEDEAQLTPMRHALWPEGSPQEHSRELREILLGQWRGMLPYVIMVFEREDGSLAGFAEVSLRSFVDGCDPDRPVAFLEGWYVASAHRRKGVGAALLHAAEEWGRAQGCVEMGSDTLLDNTGAQQAHERLGFEMVDRCVNYRKTL